MLFFLQLKDTQTMQVNFLLIKFWDLPNLLQFRCCILEIGIHLDLTFIFNTRLGKVYKQLSII